MSEVTEWLPGDVYPLHIGVYQRDIGYSQPYAMWNGAYWLAYCVTPKLAAKERMSSAFQSKPWRGLAADPSKEPA